MRGLIAVAARRLERLHDTGLVRAHRVQVAARKVRADGRRSAELGHRPVRVLFPGSGQPHRFGPVRRAVLHLGAQGHPGSRFAHGLHALRPPLHALRLPPLEPPRRLRLPGAGRLLHLPEVIPVISARIPPDNTPKPPGPIVPDDQGHAGTASCEESAAAATAGIAQTR